MSLKGFGRNPGGSLASLRMRKMAQRLGMEAVSGAATKSQQTVASASEIQIHGEGDTVYITGTTTINTIADPPAPFVPGFQKYLIFTAATPLVHSAALLLPGSANITAADGDTAWANWDEAGVWRLSPYTLANGTVLTTVPISKGGTGQTSAGPAKDALTVAATVAADTTTNLATATGDKVTITGSGATITGFGTAAAGVHRACTFAGINTLTHNATSLIIEGAANVTTAAGDTFDARSEGSGNWRVMNYVRADGAPLYIKQRNFSVLNSVGSLLTGPTKMVVESVASNEAATVGFARFFGFANRFEATHRLSMSSTIPVFDGSASLLNYINAAGNFIPGWLPCKYSGEWLYLPVGKLNLTLTLTSGKNYDVCATVEAKTVTAATNATPIRITTSASHGLNANDVVYIEGVLGNTAANGFFKLAIPAVPGSDAIDLKDLSGNDVAGNGTYTSGGTIYVVRLALSAAWTSDTARSVASLGIDGVMHITDVGRHLGIIRASATDTVADTTGTRYLVNRYNKVARPMFTCPGYVDDNAATPYNQTNTTWGQCNGGTGSTLKWISDGENPVILDAAFCMLPAAGQIGSGGIGIDSTSNAEATCYHNVGGFLLSQTSHLKKNVSEGYHAADMLCLTSGGTMAIYADNARNGAAADPPMTYMYGTVMG